jgi:hypothetical protein
MRTVKRVIAAIAFVFLMGSGNALAWTVTGRVVCGESNAGVQGVKVTIAYAGHPDYTSYSDSTDANGYFGIGVPDALTDAEVTLVFGTYTAGYSATVTPGGSIGPFSIPGDWCGTGGGECTDSVSASVFCHKPFGGGGDNECRAILPGSVSIPPGEGSFSSNAVIASTSAAFAVVKSGSGSCPGGQSTYNVIVGVVGGETVLTSGTIQAVSHITYCDCPPAQ